jgi:hypothetical protein
MGAASAILLVLVTILCKCSSQISFGTISPKDTRLITAVPPVGVYAVAGCGADLLINIALTILG